MRTNRKTAMHFDAVMHLKECFPSLAFHISPILQLGNLKLRTGRLLPKVKENIRNRP
jgi:hypothetical protein